ncbi:MAG: XRE family transcriptional regulator [Crocosphaera sp.]
MFYHIAKYMECLVNKQHFLQKIASKLSNVLINKTYNLNGLSYIPSDFCQVLEKDGLSTRQGQDRTRVNHSEFVRIRGANLKSFTIDRLILILGRLNHNVEISVTTHPKQTYRNPSKSTSSGSC